MYLFYIDESGTRDPEVQATRRDGTQYEKDHIYVLLAVSLFDGKWYGFETTLNKIKIEHLQEIHHRTGTRLELADAEVHSVAMRHPKQRDRHPLFRHLSTKQISRIANLYYRQLEHNYMHLFAIVVDKRKLEPYMDQAKLHRKAYELLLERIQNFMREYHPKHLGVIVSDDMSIQENRSLAMKHSYFQREGTTSNVVLRHIVEMPFFVRSELSNGIQLADLCAYNVYRAFRYDQIDYAPFARMLPRFYNSGNTLPEKIDGLKVFPDDSELVERAETIGKIVARHRPTPS